MALSKELIRFAEKLNRECQKSTLDIVATPLGTCNTRNFDVKVNVVTSIKNVRSVAFAAVEASRLGAWGLGVRDRMIGLLFVPLSGDGFTPDHNLKSPQKTPNLPHKTLSPQPSTAKFLTQKLLLFFLLLHTHI